MYITKHKYHSDEELHSIINFLYIYDLKPLLNRYEPLFTIDDYGGILSKYKWKCKLCNDVFADHIDEEHMPRCLKCFPPFSNKDYLKKEILEFCKSNYDSTILSDDYIALEGRNIDIYFPHKKLGINVINIYKSSELNEKDKNIHYKKYQLCKEHNINLIQIFEDEWIHNKDKVKSNILSVLNLSPNNISIEDCEIRSIYSFQVQSFLEENDFDNYCDPDGINLGLYYNGNIISLLCLNQLDMDREYQIYKYCVKNNYHIENSFSTLFTHFINLYKPNSVIGYVDIRYDIEPIYLNTNFKWVGDLNPNYYYFDFTKENPIRKDICNFQKTLQLDKLEIYNKNLTEYQNMQLNNYDRVWNSGFHIYVIRFND